MPEGPELRSSADFLSAHYLNWDVDTAMPIGGRYKISPPDGFDGFKAMLAKPTPVKLTAIDVKGKFMWWTFEGTHGAHDRPRTYYLMCTYGMAAQWVPVNGTGTKHAAFSFLFRNVHGEEKPLSFVDVRHFGTLKFIHDKRALEKRIGELGLDPLRGELNYYDLKALLETRKGWGEKPICELMLDQRVFCGVGNYLRAEALWRASIDPWRLAKDLGLLEWEILCRETNDTMRESYEAKGATISTYATPDGEAGKFVFRVFGHDKDADGFKVHRRADSNGRTVHWSPRKQR